MLVNRPVLSIGLALAAVSAAVPTTSYPSLQCQDLMIPVAAQAQNKVLSGAPNLTELTTVAALSSLLAQLEALPTQLVGGSFEISARYCAPINDVPHRRDTLQVLVHGVTLNKDYWSGPRTSEIGPGNTNTSWIYQAAQQGYSTLAIDRLCNGNSSRPDGLITCQLPLQTEVVNTLIQTARAGGLPGNAKKAWSKIQLVTHSYGSLLGNLLTQMYPDAVDQIYLTGFTQNLIFGVEGVAVRDIFLPANIAAPTRFPGLDVNYLVPTSYYGTLPTFFLGDYNNAVSRYLFDTTGTITTGELATALLGQFAAPGFTGDVFVPNGNLDNTWCNTDPVNAILGNPGNCEKYGYSEKVKDAYYQNSRNFDFHNIPNSGHCWMQHNAAVVEEGLAEVFAFAAKTGF